VFARRIVLSFAASLCGLMLAPNDAAAQWYLGGYLGGNHSQNATVSLRAPSDSLSLDFHDVRFAAESNQGRRYYGLRIGKMIGRDRCLGFEVEMIHLKAIADVTRTYDVSGLSSPGSVGAMNTIVQEYRMTHGVNLSLFNVVLKKPIGGRAALVIRGGGGMSFPHAETTVQGSVVHHYEVGGPGGQGAAGVEVRLAPGTSAIAEYKFTVTRPRIDIVNGDAWTTLRSHHFSAGLRVALSH
jgi:hypothetical protein